MKEHHEQRKTLHASEIISQLLPYLNIGHIVVSMSKLDDALLTKQAKYPIHL
jgi:hypothetical protein